MILPLGEKIIERKICPISGEEFFVTDKDLEFYDKISPVFNGKKYLIPSPALCPDERTRRRICFRNERSFHRGFCALTNQEILTVYSPDSPFVVYEQKVWWGDSWSPGVFGINFDSDKTFFEQFRKLSHQAPLPNLLTVNNENSPYANFTGESKNIYIGADVWFCRDCYFSTTLKYCENCIDIYDSEYAKYCYQCAFSKNIYRCTWAYRSYDCSDCDFIFNCRQCQYCLFCSGLFGKSYHINNKPVAKEEYERIRKDIFSSSKHIGRATEELKKVIINAVTRSNWNMNSENCIGDDLKDCKNCFYCFDAVLTEDCRYCTTAYQNKFCYDTTIYNPGTEWTIEGVCGGVNLHFAGYNYACLDSNNIWYNWGCFNAHDLFGCISLHNHEHHCILNKPYSVAEYEELCGKIIDHMRSTEEWGEFFPHELSPFGYNETVAQEYFPLTEPEVRAKGWNWCHEPVKTFEGNSIQPQGIQNYDEKVIGFEVAQKNIDELLAGVIKCEVTGKPFKIIRQELAFYIENGIPIPTKHPNQRHKERMSLRNPRKLFERQCTECNKDIITTYAPERPEKVVCEECYRKLVY